MSESETFPAKYPEAVCSPSDYNDEPYFNKDSAFGKKASISQPPEVEETYDPDSSKYWYPGVGSNNGKNKCWINAAMYAIFSNNRIRNEVLQFKMVQYNEVISFFKKCCQDTCIWNNELYEELGLMMLKKYELVNNDMVFGDAFGPVDITCTFIIKELMQIGIRIHLVSETSLMTKEVLDDTLNNAIGYVCATNKKIKKIKNSRSTDGNAGHFISGVPCTQSGCGYVVNALVAFRTNEHHKSLFQYIRTEYTQTWIITDENVVFNNHVHAKDEFVVVCANTGVPLTSAREQHGGIVHLKQLNQDLDHNYVG